MGLTRIRADQISNIDYKQAVKTITLTNISNLAGGAPLIVDGVTLSVGDRVLVTAQSTGSQNGIYVVSSTGTGNNGSWTRASDANATGDLEAGTIVMVTDGSTYADTSWKLITDDPIVIGTTPLTFLQNTGNSFNIISTAASNVAANGVSGTVTFTAGNNFSVIGNNASDVITFSVVDAPTFVGNVSAGNLSASGNVTATYYHGDGSYLTGIVPVIQAYLFANVASNISPYLQAVPINQFTPGALATATTTVGTTATLIGEFITNLGYPNATSIPAGQITGRYETDKGGGNKLYTTYFTVVKRNAAGTETVLLTSDTTTPTGVNTLVQQVTTALNTSSIALLTTDRLAVKIYAYTASGTDSITLGWDDNTDAGFDLPTSPPSIADFVPYQNATANVNLGPYSITANGIISTGNVSATGNITGSYILGNGSLLTGISGSSSYGNSNVAAYLGAGIAGNIIPSANNVFSLGSPTAQWASVYIGNATLYLGNTAISANNTSNTLVVNGNTVVTADPTGTSSTTGNVAITGNITGNNVLSSGVVSATGNVTGNYILGNGALLTGVITSVANINLGNSNVTVVSAGGNATIGIGGTANVAVFATTGEYVTGVVSASGNITGGNLTTNGTISVGGIVMSGNLIVGAGPTLTIDPNGSGGTDGNVVITGNLTVQGTTTTINSNTITTNDLQINMANNAANATAANNGGIGVGPAGAEYATLLYNTAANVWVASLGISSVGNISANNLSANTITGTLSTAAQTNITSVGTLTSLNSGVISSSGNVTGANILTGGLVSATGNATAGNVLTGGLISATGSIIGAVISIPAGALTLTNQGSVNDIIAGTKNVGQVIIGGATQTGAITVGQSTATQSLLLASGVTSSGNTKTISIGQNGAAASNTNITMGPSAGVATVNITPAQQWSLPTLRAQL
jgi:hypothetical protein